MKRTYCDICGAEMKPPATEDNWACLIAGDEIVENDCGSGNRRFSLRIKVSVAPPPTHALGVDVCADCVADAVGQLFDEMRRKARPRVG